MPDARTSCCRHFSDSGSALLVRSSAFRRTGALRKAAHPRLYRPSTPMESTPRRQCRRLLQPPLDHVVTALLTAALMDVIGGVVNVDLRQDQVPIVAGLPGVIATTTGPRPAAYGSAEFLRAGAEQPGFRLLKSGAQPPGSGEYHPPVWQFSGRAAGRRASGFSIRLRLSHPRMVRHST
ncbi:DUF6368 family protein [Streptomyces zhihengii]|uniref:DUF6368 family protein n=1 Tax=Streptomyces zhihengii TaxID=1818004 RepID=UPI0034555C72